VGATREPRSPPAIDKPRATVARSPRVLRLQMIRGFSLKVRSPLTIKEFSMLVISYAEAEEVELTPSQGNQG